MLAIGIGAYALVLVATTPATLLDAGLLRASNGRMRLADTRGTLWSGAGQFEIRNADGQMEFSNSLAWRLRSGTLLRALLAYEIAPGPGSRPFPVMIHWSRIELADVDVSVPATVLGLVFPRLAPFQLTGNMQLRIPRLVIRSGMLQGSATLEWRTAGSALAPISPLGNYAIRLEGAGSEIRATLDTLQGPLQLSGHGTWTSGHAPAFLATAHVLPQFHQQLAPFLRLIAVERSDGSFELRPK